MPTLHWALLCHQALTDETTNAVSYINAVEDFAFSSFPQQLPLITVATIWRKEKDGDDDIEMRIRLGFPDGERDEFTLETSHDFGEYRRFRVNRGIQGIPVTQPGTLDVFIEHRDEGSWNVRKHIPVEIHHEAQDHTPSPKIEAGEENS